MPRPQHASLPGISRSSRPPRRRRRRRRDRRGEAAAAAEDRGADRGLRRATRRPRCAAWAAEGRIALVERELARGRRRRARRWSTARPATRRRMRGSAAIGRAGGRAGQHRRRPRGQRLHHAGDRRPRPGDGGDRHRGRGAGAGAQDQGRGRGDAAGDARAADPDRAGVPRPGRGARLARRAAPFWTRFYFERGPRALEAGEEAARDELERCWPRARRRGGASCTWSARARAIPELLTLKARRLLHEADVVVHDRLVPPAILELARREAAIVEVGKTAYGAVLEAGRHQRADRAARARPARRWCG